jgi:hypothetical protein
MRLRVGLSDEKAVSITLIVLSQSRDFNRSSDPAVLLDCLKIVATLAATRQTSALRSRSDDRFQSTRAGCCGAIGNLRLQQDAGLHPASVIYAAMQLFRGSVPQVLSGRCGRNAIALVFPAPRFEQG